MTRNILKFHHVVRFMYVFLFLSKNMNIQLGKHYDAYSMEDSDNETRHDFNAVVTQQDLNDIFNTI